MCSSNLNYYSSSDSELHLFHMFSLSNKCSAFCISMKWNWLRTTETGNQHETNLSCKSSIMNEDPNNELQQERWLIFVLFTSWGTRKSPPFDPRWFNDFWATFSSLFMGSCVGLLNLKRAFNIHSLSTLRPLMLYRYWRQVVDQIK